MMKTGFLPLLLLAPCAAAAGVESLVPSEVGLAVTARQSPFIGGDVEVGAKFASVDREGFDISGAVFQFSKSDTRRFYVGAGLEDWDYKRGDSPQLSDMNELDRAIDLRAGAAWKLAAGSVNAEIGKDVAAHKGMQAHLRYTANSLSEQFVLRPYVEGQWLSADLTDYYVGVDADEVRAGRPAYEADDALALKAGLKLERRLAPRWTLVGSVDVTHYDAEIGDSPIIEDDTLLEGQVGVTYQWR